MKKQAFGPLAIALIVSGTAAAQQTGAPECTTLINGSMPNTLLLEPQAIDVLWVDAEFYSDPTEGRDWMVFQEEHPTDAENGKAWLAEIDPASGRCMASNCREHLVADSVARVEALAWKGPNFGLYNDGGTPRWNIYFNKLSSQRPVPPECTNHPCLEVWQAQPEFNGGTPKFHDSPLFTESPRHRMNILGSLDPTSDEVLLLYGDQWAAGRTAWAETSEGGRQDQSASSKASFRWVQGRQQWTASHYNEFDPNDPEDGEIQLTTITDNTAVTRILTSTDNIEHIDAYGWVAPESMGGVDVYLVARAKDAANEGKLLVYKRNNCGTPPCSPLYTLDKKITVPTGANGAFDGANPTAYLQSWEPFVYDAGNGPETFFVGTVKANPGLPRAEWGESEIWVVSYASLADADGDDAVEPKLACRVHTRAANNLYHEGEFYKGSAAPFIAFNEIVLDGDQKTLYMRLWRSRVDLTY